MMQVIKYRNNLYGNSSCRRRCRVCDLARTPFQGVPFVARNKQYLSEGARRIQIKFPLGIRLMNSSPWGSWRPFEGRSGNLRKR